MPVMVHRATCPTITLRQLRELLSRDEELDESTAKKVLALLLEIYDNWPMDVEFPVELSDIWFMARRVLGIEEKR